MGRPTYFSSTYVEHLRSPQHLAPPEGPAWEADGVGVMEGPRLRTALRIWVALDPGPDRRVTRLAWRGEGFPEAVPAASAMSVFILEQGLGAQAAASLGVEEVAALLGGLPHRREEAILRTLQALRRALSAAGALDLPPGDDDLDGELACHCVGLSFGDLRALAGTGLSHLALQRRTALGTGCGTCLMSIHAYLDGLEG